MGLATIIDKEGNKYTKELTKKLIIISPDGVNSEHFIDSVYNEDLPNLKELFENYLVKTKYNTPMMSSDTGPNHDAINTAMFSDQPGLKVIKNGKEIDYYSFGMVVRSWFSGNPIQEETCLNKTLLEYGFFGDDSVIIYDAWNKGAKKKIGFRGSLFPILKFFIKNKIKNKIKREAYKNRFKENSRLFCDGFNKLVNLKVSKYLKKNPLPDYFFLWYYPTDKSAHEFGFGKELIKSYKKIDEAIALIKNKAIKENNLENTLFVIASDHGMAKVEKNLSLDEILRNINLDANAVFFGYGSARIYLKEKDKKNIRNIRNISEKLVKQEGIDFVLTKYNNYFLVFNEKGIAKIEYKDDKYRYTIINNDPLNFDENVYKLISEFHTSEQDLEYTFDQKYRCAPVLLFYVLRNNPNRIIRSGDIAIFAKENYDFSKGKNTGIRVLNNLNYITQDGAYQKDNINTFLLISGYGNYIERINKERIKNNKQIIAPIENNYMFMPDFPVTLLDLAGWDYDVIEKFNFDGKSVFQRNNNELYLKKIIRCQE